MLSIGWSKNTNTNTNTIQISSIYRKRPRKSVAGLLNGIRISIWNIPSGKMLLPFTKCSVAPEHFRLERPISIYFSTGFSGNLFVNVKKPKAQPQCCEMPNVNRHNLLWFCTVGLFHEVRRFLCKVCNTSLLHAFNSFIDIYNLLK